LAFTTAGSPAVAFVVEFAGFYSFFLSRGLAVAAVGLGCPTAVAAGCGVVVSLVATTFSCFS